MSWNLRARLANRPALLVPGVFDPLSALLAEAAGFEALYVSGASIAYTQLGRPDIGLVSLEQLVDVVSRISDRVAAKLLVDADTGFGNALNVQRTVRLLERAGASAIQLEDQMTPKRCGHLAGKAIVSATEMVGKIHAAVDTRRSAETLIIARTDAVAVEGLGQALDRAGSYLAAGADVLFIEAPTSLKQMEAIVEQFGPRVPLLANMVEGGDTPISGRDALSKMGYAVIITPGSFVRALIPLAEEFFASLRETGSTLAFRDRMTDLRGVNVRIGLAELMARGKRYDADLKPGFEP